MKKQYLVLFLIVLLSVANFSAISPDEGMFPLSEIKKIDLKKAGLKIPQSEVYNPNGLSLIDALVNVGGCTGSFVSNQGLIITNHHCAFESVQLVSTPEKDYLTNGFVARTKEEELPAKNLTCKITDSYEDVSLEILASIKEVADPSERINVIAAKVLEIIKREETKDKTIKAEVSEMFIGRTYVLFRYKVIKDVRLVYVPQLAVGEFGGESDNWVWPKHTGDFSFLRAYVAKDGSSAGFSKDNIPYQPKKFLKVNPNGANDGDFVFVLGYPGRTFRNYPAKYIEYQEKYLLPYTSELFEWQNKQMAKTSTSKELELKQASRIKRKANVLKNYKGKIKGLKGIELLKQKYEQEKELQAFIDADPILMNSYGKMLNNIDLVYNDLFKDAKKFLVLEQVVGSSNALGVANLVIGLQSKIMAAKVEDQEKVYQDGKYALLKASEILYESFVLETDKILLNRILVDAYQLEGDLKVNLLPNQKSINSATVASSSEKYINQLFDKTKFTDSKFVGKLLEKPMQSFLAAKDPMIDLAYKSKIYIDEMNVIKKNRNGKLNKLLGDFVEVSIAFKKSNFIPDANSTLRLTFGNVKGYTPVDATYMKPTTTLTGLIEKGEDHGDYYLPTIFKELYKKKDFGKFTCNDGKDVPVAFIYNLDTTGGNSGSPIMDENGNLVGVNFDRAYEATINDFAWNESYSRSIGCDIRYVLWVAQKIDHADFILTELGVN